MTRIYGGTSEVMKLIISKSMGLLLGIDGISGCVGAGGFIAQGT